MRGLALIMGVGGLALVVAAVGLAIWAYVPGDPLSIIGTLLADADPIAKVALFLVVGCLAAITVVGGSTLFRSSRGSSDGLMVLGWIAPGVGVLAAIYGGLNIRTAVVRTNTTNLMVIAPSVAEVILIAGISLLVGGLALGINAILAARARPS